MTVFILCLLCAAFSAFFRILVNADEMWNYSFALNISRGLVPYRDFNYLQTPFSAFLNGFLLSLFGRHVLVMRLAGALLFTLTAFLFYRISRRLGSSPLIASLPGFILILVFSGNIFLEYSDLILFIIMALMALDLKALGEGPALCMPKPLFSKGVSGVFIRLAAGIMAGLAALSKQSYGSFVAAASLISLTLICLYHGLSIKESLRALFMRMVGMFLPWVMFFLYLLHFGALRDFWDMCVLGIGTFSSRYRYTALMRENPGYFAAGLALPTLIIIGIIYMISLLWRGRNAGSGSLPKVGTAAEGEVSGDRAGSQGRLRGFQMALILVYGIFGLINMLPLANLFHFEICAMPFMAAAELMWGRTLSGMRGAKVVSGLAAGAVLVFLLVYNPVDIARNYDFIRDIKGYEGLFIERELYDEIGEVQELVLRENALGNEVYVLDNRATFYFAPMGIYHKYLDMFLQGNLGTKTPQECLDESLSPGNLYLIPEGDRENTQLPRKAIDNFKKGLSREGSVCGLGIYRADFVFLFYPAFLC